MLDLITADDPSPTGRSVMRSAPSLDGFTGRCVHRIGGYRGGHPDAFAHLIEDVRDQRHQAQRN